MRNNARRGLELRKEWKRGGTDAGVRRARQIAAGGDLSQATIRNMKAFFARFGANFDRDYNKEQPDGGPSASRLRGFFGEGQAREVSQTNMQPQMRIGL